MKNKTEYIREYHKTHPHKVLLARAKSSAKRKGLEFNLVETDIFIPNKCPYFGTDLTLTFGKGYCIHNLSIDRIDSTKGYVKGNVQVLSRLANQMKSNATTEQLLIFARNVLKIHNA